MVCLSLQDFKSYPILKSSHSHTTLALFHCQNRLCPVTRHFHLPATLMFLSGSYKEIKHEYTGMVLSKLGRPDYPL